MKTSEITSKINDAVSAKCANVECRIRGLAQPIYIVESDSEKEIPAVVFGEQDYDVFLDDRYVFGIYHKLNGKTYTTDYKSGYGGNAKKYAIVDMSLICWGFTSCVSMEGLEQLILSVMPKDYQVVKTDFDKKRVFSAEFSGVTFFVPETAFLFKMNYLVKVEFKPDCLELEEIFN